MTWGRRPSKSPPARVAAKFKAKVKVITGPQLLKRNFPMIHAVGRAASERAAAD